MSIVDQVGSSGHQGGRRNPHSCDCVIAIHANDRSNTDLMIALTVPDWVGTTVGSRVWVSHTKTAMWVSTIERKNWHPRVFEANNGGRITHAVRRSDVSWHETKHTRIEKQPGDKTLFCVSFD